MGRGGFGSVWEAWDTRLQRTVAVKSLAGAESLPEAWGLREARLTARLRHPAFVTVHEVMHDAGRPYLVMERIEGSTLAEVAAKGPVAPAQVRDWLRQAAEALAQAHRQGVAHGDVKPSNLMIEPGGRLRLLDLGIAELQDPAATLGVPGTPAGGTLAYLAPERLLGARPDPASDAYSLGLTMHELLGGPRSSGGAGLLAIAHRRLTEDGAPAPAAGGSHDPTLSGLLDAMTRREPALRPDMATIAARLQAGTGGA
ncbi:MAG TPA: serine/threonine-protein kinase, partial [Burkholderiaceae bacterium]